MMIEKFRPLGSSGLMVSPICVGTMMFGGMTEETESRRIIDHARDHGVNFIDTADVYADGRSEEIVGRAVSQNRDHWVLATKVGLPVIDDPSSGGLSRDYVLRALERSLKRLNTDYVDLYYIHRYDPKTPVEEIAETFGSLIREGKISHFGISNTRAWRITDLIHHCRQAGGPQPVACQPYYNLLNRMPEVEVIPASHNFGLGVVPYSPVARDVLTGKYEPSGTPPKGSRAERKDARMISSEWRPESLNIASKLKRYLQARDKNLVHFAFAWVLNNSAVSAAIAGPRTFDQWTDYLGALDYTWTAEDEALVDQLVAPGHPSTSGYTDPKYPVRGRFPIIPAD